MLTSFKNHVGRFGSIDRRSTSKGLKYIIGLVSWTEDTYRTIISPYKLD